MTTTKKKTSTKIKRKVRIQTVRPTQQELKEATQLALKQYKTAVKNLAHR